MKEHFIVHWRYSDGSASGVLPRVLTQEEVRLFGLIQEIIGFDKDVQIVKVTMPEEVTA